MSDTFLNLQIAGNIKSKIPLDNSSIFKKKSTEHLFSMNNSG